jgi:hypothetical protein
MSLCWFLRLVGVGLELLAYLNIKDWAEQRALAIKNLLPVATATLVVASQYLWKAFVVAFAAIGAVGLLVKCTTGGFGPEANPILNVIAFPVAALGTGMLVAFVLAAIVGVSYVVLEVLAQTPRGILSGIGIVCIVLSFLINCQ